GAQSTRSAKERSAMICQSATIRCSHSRSSDWRLVCSRTRSFIEGMRPVSPIVREDLAMSELASESMNAVRELPTERQRGCNVSELASESMNAVRELPTERQRGCYVSDMWDWLEARAADREAAGLRRRLWTREADHALVDLAGNDY